MDDIDAGPVNQLVGEATKPIRNCIAPVLTPVDRQQDDVAGPLVMSDLLGELQHAGIRQIGEQVDS